MKEKVGKETEEQMLSIQDMSLTALFAALIAACSFIRIPIGPVPFTLQTFAVFVTAGLLGAKRGTLSVVLYILLGLIGIPVFAGAGEPGVIAGPTGGYITGFVFTALIVGLLTENVRTKSAVMSAAVTIAAMLLGDIVCFVIGTVQYMYVSGTGLAVSLSYCVTPFIIPDIVKIVLASIIVQRLKRHVSKLFRL